MSSLGNGRTAQETQPTRARANQEAFLSAYANLGNISAAAAAVPIGRRQHYRWLESDETYKEAFEAAEEEFRDRVRGAVRSRAIDGWQEPIVFKGQITKDENGTPVTVTKYSDRLLELLAKAKVPEFREKFDVRASEPTLAEILGESFAHSAALDEVERRHAELEARTQAERTGSKERTVTKEETHHE